MTTPHDQALQQWLDRLDAQPLPVLPASLPQVEAMLKDNQVALNDVAQVINTDPVLSLHLLREGQRLFGKRLAGPPADVLHCITLLGITRLRTLLGTFRPLILQPTDPIQQAYLRAIGISLHATLQIYGWNRYRSQPGTDQLLQAVLLYGAADWALWHVASQDMQVLERLANKEQIPAREAELAVLGCTRDQLALGLGKRWGFSRDVLECLEPARMPSPGFLLRCAHQAELDPNYRLPNRDDEGHLIRSAGQTLRLADWLAREAARDWYSGQVRRCLHITAIYLNLPLDELQALAKDCAIVISRNWPIPGMAAPAANLLWPVQPRRPRRIKPRQLKAAVAQLRARQTPATVPPAAPQIPAPKPAPQPVPQRQEPPVIGMANDHLPPELNRSQILNAPPPPPPPTAPAADRHTGSRSAEKKQRFLQFQQQLAQSPDHFRSEHEVLRATVEILHECTALERVLVATVSNEQVESYFALGCEQAPAMKRLKIALQPVNLLTHLLKQPAGAWINPDRPNKMNALVPGALKQATQCGDFFLMSVFNQRGACALFYADRTPGARLGLSEHEYTLFKAACTGCSKHLIARGKRAAARRTPE